MKVKSHVCPCVITLYQLSIFTFTYPLTARTIEAPQMISQPVFSIFPCSLLPSGTWRTPGLSIPDVIFPSLLLSALSSCRFTVPCKTVLARPCERETCPYYFSLRLFTVIRRFSCGSIACWILARISSLVTWSLYEMRSILQ